MEEPRELTVEELEAEELGELPDRDALSLLRPSSLHPLLSLPVVAPEPDPVGPADDLEAADASNPSR